MNREAISPQVQEINADTTTPALSKLGCSVRYATNRKEDRNPIPPIVKILLITAVVMWLVPVPSSAQYAPVVQAVDSVGITVSDMDNALDFYTKVLPFEVVSDVELAGTEYEHLQGLFGLRIRVVRLRLGGEFIELIDYLAPEGRQYPADFRSNDKYFQHIAMIVTDMNAAYQMLRRHKVQHASSGPQRLPEWNKNAGGIEAFYFKDPDGNVLEILQFPPDKGDPKWHRKSDALFLGIDHTAIVVSDTEQSLKFYRDKLGMTVAGESENYGTEQEHLNNVFGARLKITALRAPSGPGIEFLEYLAPSDGRPTPQGIQSNDLFHWQTRLMVRNLEGIADQLQSDTLVSAGTVELSNAELGFKKGLLVRDPDGHAMQLVQQ